MKLREPSYSEWLNKTRYRPWVDEHPFDPPLPDWIRENDSKDGYEAKCQTRGCSHWTEWEYEWGFDNEAKEGAYCGRYGCTL